jgi:hypothetical protein
LLEQLGQVRGLDTGLSELLHRFLQPPSIQTFPKKLFGILLRRREFPFIQARPARPKLKIGVEAAGLGDQQAWG